MNFLTKLAAAAALTIILAPATALAYYPYTYFTGTSYLSGPDYMVGAGGFQTGPIGMYSQGAGYYGSSNCNQYYGCGTIGYNPMTGQGSGSWAGNTTGYGYGSGCNAYVPNNVCGVIGQYTQYLPGNNGGYGMYGSMYGGYGYGMGYGYSGYSY